MRVPTLESAGAEGAKVMESIAGAVGSQILSAVVAAVLTGLGGLVRWFVVKRLPARRTWRCAGAGELSVVLDTAHMDTGRYQRPVAGLGQVRALSLLIPCLSQPTGTSIWRRSGCRPHPVSYAEQH